MIKKTIRNNPEWYNQAGWLSQSTQARLEMYNPLVMSKVFLLNDAKIMDPFNSDMIKEQLSNLMPFIMQENTQPSKMLFTNALLIS